MNKQNNKFKQWNLLDILKDPYFYVALALAVLIAIFLPDKTLKSLMVDLGGVIAGVSSALLGIVIAGLAIFLAFMDKEYIALVDKYFGIGNELFPIKITTILSIISLIFSLGLILIGESLIIIYRLISFGALWTYLYLLWQIWELVKWLVSHAKLRATQIRLELKQDDKQK